jgi:hypothetical protein
MDNEPEIIPPDRFNQTPKLDVTNSSSANPAIRFLDKLRRKSVSERRALVKELAGLCDDLSRLNGAYTEYQRSLVGLKTLDQLLAVEERKVLATLDSQERQLLLQIRNDELRLMIEQADLELKHETAQRRLDQIRNPPERKHSVDPIEESIKDAFAGGGKYTRQANALRDELIRKRGGEDKLDDEDKERIRNAFAAGAKGDHSQGR